MAGDPAQIIAAVGCFAVIGFVVLGPIGRAFADRLRGKQRDAALDSGEVEALRDDVVQLQRELAEVQNRLDFTERVLAQARERGLLGEPKER